MSHATIHATFAAREVLIIPSPPWRSRIVSTRGRLRFRERTDYWQKYHPEDWKTDRERRRLGYRAMAGETNDRPSTLRQKTSGRPLLRRGRGAGRPTASSTPSAMELPSRPCTGHRHLSQANGSQHDEHEDADLPESSNARPLLHLVPAATHAGAIGLVVPLEVGLLLRLRLLVCRRRISVRAPLAHETCRRSDSGADRRALAGIPPDGAADGAEGGASGAAPDRSALLRRRGGDLYGLRGIHAGLALCPVVAVELIAPELVLAFTLLGIHEHFGTGRAGEHQQCQHRADGHQSLHVSTPWKTVIEPAG